MISVWLDWDAQILSSRVFLYQNTAILLVGFIQGRIIPHKGSIVKNRSRLTNHKPSKIDKEFLFPVSLAVSQDIRLAWVTNLSLKQSLQLESQSVWMCPVPILWDQIRILHICNAGVEKEKNRVRDRQTEKVVHKAKFESFCQIKGENFLDSDKTEDF